MHIPRGILFCRGYDLIYHASCIYAHHFIHFPYAYPLIWRNKTSLNSISWLAPFSKLHGCSPGNTQHCWGLCHGTEHILGWRMKGPTGFSLFTAESRVPTCPGVTFQKEWTSLHPLKSVKVEQPNRTWEGEFPLCSLLEGCLLTASLLSIHKEIQFHNLKDEKGSLSSFVS